MQLMLQLILLVCFAFKVASFMPIVRSISQPIRNCPIKLISFHKWRIQQLKRYSSTLSNGDQILYVPVSFYNFIKYNETELKEIESRAFEYLESLPALGTLLLASEGYNAQLTFPESKVDHFSSTIRDVLRDPQLNLNMGKSYLVSDQRAKEQFPYKKLMVKRKPKVLTDGFLDSNDASNVSFDWSKNNGIELPPELWHQEISAASSDSNKDDSKSKVLILDCRNDYESSVGTFKNAIPLNTTKFSESWDKLDELLKDTPKDVKLLTFCTGNKKKINIKN